ncbi:APC family permease [Actinocatenispora sera]|uniref:APC family permease n=1 Tax=Actinocatenispora sera TaxID=390989 RepID=UPI0033FEFD7C
MAHPAVLRPNQLSTVHTTVFIMSSQAPLTVLCGVVTTMYAATQVTAVPWAFVVVAGVIGLFLPGYLAMSKRTANPGAFYSIIAQGLSRSVALAAGPIAYLAYVALQVGLYGLIGPFASGVLSGWTGLHVTTLQVQLAAWALVLLSGLFRIKITGWFVSTLMLCEVALVVVLDAFLAPHPYQGAPQWGTLNPAHLLGGSAGGVATTVCIAFLAFVGVELGVVMQSETRNRKRAIVRGTVTAMLVITALYALTSWLMGWVAGDHHLVRRAQAEAQNLLFDLARPHVGPVIIDAANALFGTSVLIALITFAMTCNRYAFSLAREGFWFPAAVGRPSVRQGVPATAAFLQAGIGLAAIGVWYVAGWDPLVTLFYYGGTLGGFMVMVLFALVSLSVFVYFRRRTRSGERDGESPLVRAVLPLTAFVLLSVMVVLSVINYDVMLGVAPDSPLRWILPTIPFALLLVLGALGLVLRRVRPQQWRRIGLGTDADLADDTQTEGALA